MIIEWVGFSAWLFGDLEFDTFWRSVLSRMESNEAPTDFNEPRMAHDLREHILGCEGRLIRALWASGLVVSNCIERCHRTVKGLLPGRHWSRDLATSRCVKPLMASLHRGIIEV